MTRSGHDNALEERFHSYQRFLFEGAWYSAAVKLAEIFHASAMLSDRHRVAWNRRLRKELTEKFLREVRSGQEHNIQRIHRILSVGSEWTGEEILLLMQERINVRLLADFLGNAVDVDSVKHLSQVDAQLSSLAESKNHAKHFRWGLQRIKKTSLSDIEPVWLSLLRGDSR